MHETLHLIIWVLWHVNAIRYLKPKTESPLLIRRAGFAIIIPSSFRRGWVVVPHLAVMDGSTNTGQIIIVDRSS